MKRKKLRDEGKSIGSDLEITIHLEKGKKRLSKRYRKGVGALILNQKGDKIFVAKRASNKFESSGANKDQTIQLPQGGMDKGERKRDSLFREIYEEIGVNKNKFKLLFQTFKPFSYLFPQSVARNIYNGRYIGQSITWYCLRFLGKDEDFVLDRYEPAEFSKWLWVRPQDLLENSVDFKRTIYKKVLNHFNQFIMK